MPEPVKDAVTAVVQAKLSAHVVALIFTALGVFVSVYMHDPHCQEWLKAHWWANDFVHAAVVAVPPILVYFKSQDRAA